MGTLKKISLRGSFAAEVAQRIKSAPYADMTTILNACLLENTNDIIQVHQKDAVLIGKKSEIGKFPPDW